MWLQSDLVPNWLSRPHPKKKKKESCSLFTEGWGCWIAQLPQKPQFTNSGFMHFDPSFSFTVNISLKLYRGWKRDILLFSMHTSLLSSDSSLTHLLGCFLFFLLTHSLTHSLTYSFSTSNLVKCRTNNSSRARQTYLLHWMRATASDGMSMYEGWVKEGLFYGTNLKERPRRAEGAKERARRRG